MKKLGPYLASHRKALVAYAGAVLTVAVAVAPASKWVAVAVAVAAALGVHGIPNAPVPPPPVAPEDPVPNFVLNQPTGTMPPDTPPTPAVPDKTG